MLARLPLSQDGAKKCFRSKTWSDVKELGAETSLRRLGPANRFFCTSAEKFWMKNVNYLRAECCQRA